MENNPTQWSPKPSKYSWFIDSPDVYGHIGDEFYDRRFKGYGLTGAKDNQYELLMREARQSEIRAGFVVPGKDEQGRLKFLQETSTDREVAAAGLERFMERATASGWAEKNPYPVMEDYRRLTTGTNRDFNIAKDVESLQVGDYGDWWDTFLDAMPFTAKGSAEPSELMDKFLKSKEDDYTTEKRLKDLDDIIARDPNIAEFAEAYGVDLTTIALNARSGMALPFMVESAIQEALINARYKTYEDTTLGWSTRLRWNLGEMVQDPYFIRDMVVTTAATAGLGAVQLAGARLGAAGMAGGRGVSQAAAKLLQATGPMVGLVEGPTFLALRSLAPRLGTVGARALAIGTEGFIAGASVGARTQMEDYARRDLLFNDLNGEPFKMSYGDIATAGIYGAGLSVLALTGMRSILGAVGDISAAYGVKKAGGNFSDAMRAYGKEWSNSLDTWATTADGLTVWGNTLSNGRGIYFGDWIDRVIKRSGIDDRNFTNVFAGKSRVWGRVDPVMAARLNIDMTQVGKIVDEFEAITGVAGEAAMKGAAGAEVSGVFRALTDAQTMRRNNLSSDEIVGIMRELKQKIDNLSTTDVPTAAGTLLRKPADMSYEGAAKAAVRAVNLLSLDKTLNSRGTNILEARDLVQGVLGRTDLNAMDDADFANLAEGVYHLIGNKTEKPLIDTMLFSLGYEPRIFGGAELTDAEANGIRSGLLDAMFGDREEFIIFNGTAAANVNRKTGQVTPIARTLEADANGKLKTFVEIDGEKIELKDLEGDNVVSSESVAALINETNAKVKAQFDALRTKKMQEAAKRNIPKAADADAEVAKIQKAFDKGVDPSPKSLAKVFGLSTQQAAVAYLAFRAMGFDPKESTLRLSKGRETSIVNGKMRKDAILTEQERARIFWMEVDGASTAMIRAIAERADLGTALHEMGHFASLMTFGRGTYDPANLRTLGISEELETKFLEWAKVNTVGPDGKRLSNEEIAAQFETVDVQERLANAWTIYMRNVLTNKAYKGDTAVLRLLNKLGDYVGNVGDALKSTEAGEAAVRADVGEVIGSAAEEIFNKLIARSDANTEDMLRFATQSLFKDLSPELKQELGVQILGEARYNTWKARKEKETTKSTRSVRPKAAAASVTSLSHTDVHAILKKATETSLVSADVKKLITSLETKFPKADGEDPAAYAVRIREKLEEAVDAKNAQIDEITKRVKAGALTKAGPEDSVIKVQPRHMKAISDEELTRIAEGRNPEVNTLPLGPGAWKFDDAGNLILTQRVVTISEGDAKAELAFRKARRESIKNKEKAKAEAAPAKKEDPKVVEERTEAKAETEEKLERAEAVTELVEEIAEERVTIAPPESETLRVTDSNGVELKNLSVGEKAAAVVNDMAVRAADQQTEVIERIAAATTVEEAVAVVGDRTEVTAAGETVTLPRPTEPVTPRNVVNAEARPKKSTVINEVVREVNEARARPNAERIERAVNNTDVTQPAAVQSLRDMLAAEGIEDNAAITAFIKGKLVRMNSVVDSIREGLKTAQLDSKQIEARFNVNDVDIERYIEVRGTLDKIERGFQNDPVVMKARDELVSNPSQESADALFKTLSAKTKLSADAQEKLRSYAKVANIEAELAMLTSYMHSLTHVTEYAERYKEALAAVEAGTATRPQKATVTEYEKHMSRVEIGPLDRVADLNQADEKVHYKTAAKNKRQASLLSGTAEAEARRMAATEIVSKNREAFDLADMDDTHAVDAILDLTTPYTVKERGSTDYKIAVLVWAALREGMTMEQASKIRSLLDAEINKEFASLTAKMQLIKEPMPKDSVVKNLSRQIDNRGHVPDTVVAAVDRSFDSMVSLAKGDNTDFIALLEHPAIQAMIRKAGDSFDVMNFAATVFEKTRDADIMSRLANDDVAALDIAILSKKAEISRAKSDDARNRLQSELSELEKDRTAFIDSKNYQEIVKKALAGRTELPQAFRRYIRGIASRMSKVDSKETAGTTVGRISIDAPADGKQIQVEDTGRGVAHAASQIEGTGRLYNIVLQDLRTGDMFLNNLSAEKRSRLADIMDAMRAVVESEHGMDNVTGEFRQLVSNSLVTSGKEPLGEDAFDTATKTIDDLMVAIYGQLGEDNRALAQFAVANRLGTIRNRGKMQNAYAARMQEKLGLPVAVNVKKVKKATGKAGVEVVPAKTEPTNEVTSTPIVREDGSTGTETIISFSQSRDLAAEIYNAYKVTEKQGKPDFGSSDLKITYDALPTKLAKDIFAGRVKNGLELAQRILESTKNVEYKALLEDMIALRKSDLAKVIVMPAADRGTAATASYYWDYNTIGFFNFGRKEEFEGLVVHELVHAVTSRLVEDTSKRYNIGGNGQDYLDGVAAAATRLDEEAAVAATPEEATKLLVLRDLMIHYLDYVAYVSDRYNQPIDTLVFSIEGPKSASVLLETYGARNLHEFLANPLTGEYYRSHMDDMLPSVLLDEVEFAAGSRYTQAIADLKMVALGSEDSKVMADLHLANTMVWMMNVEGFAPPPFEFRPLSDYRPNNNDSTMFFRYDPETSTTVPASVIKRPTVKSYSQTFDEIINGPDVEAKVRADHKAAHGRLMSFMQKREEFELRARIETEGAAGKDVSEMEARLDDLVAQAEERQRILRGMGLHEETELRDLQAMQNAINGNDMFYTSNVKENMKMISLVAKATSPAARAERPGNIREMDSEQRAQFLLGTVMPKIQEVLGKRDETAGVFSVMTDSTIGRNVFNRLIGGAVDYQNVADSNSLYLQFFAKFFDPMMDLRDTELQKAFNMPSVDRLNAEASGILISSGLAAVQEKIVARTGSQAEMDAINDAAWTHLADPSKLSKDTPNYDLVMETITAVNRVNEFAHEVLRKYGSLRSDATAAEYGTVRKAGYLASQDKPGFIEAMYKFMLGRAIEDHKKGQISALAAEALGWLDVKRNDATEDIEYVKLTENSPLAKLLGAEVGEEIDWATARKAFKDGVKSLSADEGNQLLNALSTSANYRDSYRRIHSKRDDSYSVIRQAAEIAVNRYMGLGGVGDAKTIKPRAEAKGGGYRYSEERIMTHEELASNPELSKYFDKNVMELSNALVRNQVLDAMATRAMSEFFGGEVRVSVLDLIEILRQAAEEEAAGGTLSTKERLAIDKGYERIKTVWEDFTGRLPSGKDSVDAWYNDFLKASRAAVLVVGGPRAAGSSIPELTRGILASDHHRPMLTQIVGNLMKLVKYGTPYIGKSNRTRLMQTATAYQWIRNMSTDVILARSEMMPDNPFHNLSFGGRKGFLSGWMNAWRGVQQANSVETSNFRKVLNYLGLPATIAGTPLAYINMVTTAIHIDNAQRNLTNNIGNFRRMIDEMAKGPAMNHTAFERMAAAAGLSGKEALDLNTAGVLRREIVDVMAEMAADPTTKVDGLLDIRKMHEWAETQTKHPKEVVYDAINAMQTYVNMTIRHTNAEPTLLDKRVAQSTLAQAMMVFMQFLLSHSIQEIGRRRRYSTVNYSKHLVGLMLMEAGVGAIHKHVWGSDRDKERSTTEDIVRTATSIPVLGTYQFLGAMIRQALFAMHDSITGNNDFKEEFTVPGLMDSPASNAPRRFYRGTAWGMDILKELYKTGL